MRKISKENIEKYLKEWHYCTLEELFNPKVKHYEHTFEIFNDVFREFSGHMITPMGLTCDNPKQLSQFYYHNYRNFHHINSIEDLIKDLKQALELQEKNKRDFKGRLNSLKRNDLDKKAHDKER